MSKFVKNMHMANALDREMYMKGRESQSGHITIEQYNKELDEAMGRVGRGEYTTFEDLEKEMKSW